MVHCYSWALPGCLSPLVRFPFFKTKNKKNTLISQPREQTSSSVTGYPNNCYKKYKTKEKALSAYKSAWDRGEVQGKVYPGARVVP